jgi:hypothetical protein
MRILLLLVLLAAPSFAAERTLRELIDRVAKDGEENSLDPATSAAFGLPKADTAVKDMWINAADAPDHRDHVFNLLVKKAADGRPEAFGVIMQASKETDAEKVRNFEGAGFRTNLKGEIVAAMKADGVIGSLKQTKLPFRGPTGKAAAAAFEKELAFWLKDSAALELHNK